MPRPVRIEERAMEVQAAVELLWSECVASRDYVLLSDARALRELVSPMRAMAHRMAGRASRIDTCGDGLFGPAHGRAA